MKQSNFSFADGFNPNRLGQINRKLGKPLMAFDWDKAAEIIKEKLKLHPDLKAEAGLKHKRFFFSFCAVANINLKN